MIVVVKAGHRCFGEGDEVSEAEASLYGALVGAELRGDKLVLPTSSAIQRNRVRQWALDATKQSIFAANSAYMKFTGLAVIRSEMRFLVHEANHKIPRYIREATEEIQKAWITGLVLANGQWTVRDFELELENSEVSETVQLVCANFGVRWGRYATLNTFGEPRWKLFLRSQADYQSLLKIFFSSIKLPPFWGGRSVKEELPTHPTLVNPLREGRDLLVSLGIRVDFDSEDISPENLSAAAAQIRPWAKTKNAIAAWETLYHMGVPGVSTDRVIGTEKKKNSTPNAVLSGLVGETFILNGLVTPILGENND